MGSSGNGECDCILYGGMDGRNMLYIIQEAGRANESFACDILSDSTLTPEQLDQLGWASASIFAGASLSNAIVQP